MPHVLRLFFLYKNLVVLKILHGCDLRVFALAALLDKTIIAKRDLNL